MLHGGVLTAFLLGSLAIFLGLSPVLDDVVKGLREFLNVIGTPVPLTRVRQEHPVSRGERICFVVAGAVVILAGVLEAALRF
jgi:hypothetical protein